MADCVMSVRLSPSSVCSGNFVDDLHWFSKGTIERFVRFVSTPEVIERAFMVESKIKQIEEISTVIATQSFCDGDDGAMTTATLTTKGSSDFDAFHQLLLKASTVPVKKALFEGFNNGGDIRRWLLLKILKSEWHKLQKMLELIFHQAASAGFDIDHIPDLLVFADHFGSPQLRNSCSKFLAMLEKRQSNSFCLNEPQFEVSFSSAKHMTAMDNPGSSESAEDNWFLLNHVSHDYHTVGPAENSVSDAPLFSQICSAIAACKAAGLFHEPVTPLGLDANLLDFDELESWESNNTYGQNLRTNQDEGLVPVSRHDCHATLEKYNSQLELVGQGGVNRSSLMEPAADKQDIPEQVPGGIPKVLRTEEPHDSPPMLSLTSECRTGKACECLVESSESVSESEKCSGCNKKGSRPSYIEAVTCHSDCLPQSPTEQLKEDIEDWKTLSCLAGVENLDKSNAHPCEASEVRQVIKYLTTRVMENRAESIYVQTEMQALQVLSEGYNRGRQRSQGKPSMTSPHNLCTKSEVCTGTELVNVETPYFLNMLSDLSFLEKDLFSISKRNYLTERKGRLYEHYRKHRDAKLRKESALRKAEKRAKLEALQEVLEQRKSEMIFTKTPHVKRHHWTEQGSQTNNVSGKPNSPSEKTENTTNPLEESSAPDQRFSKVGSISERKVVSLSQKPLVTSTFRSSSNSLVSPSQTPMPTFSSKSISKRQSSTLTRTCIKAEKTLRKAGSASPKGPKNETTKRLSRRNDKHSQEDKGSFLSVKKSKAGVNASAQKPSDKSYPSKSNSFSLSPSEQQRIFPGRKRISAFADSNGVQTPLHSSELVTMKIMQSQSHPQNKAYKVSLTLTVSKNSKPFLRKGHGIGPGAGPGVVKLKASLGLDSHKIHNEDLLQTSGTNYAETVATLRVENQTEESAEELNQMECLESCSKAMDNVLLLDREETPSIDLSPENLDVDQCSSVQCCISMQDTEGDMFAIRSSYGNLTHTADLQSKCSNSNAASSTSSLTSRLEKHLNDNDDRASVPLVSNISQLKPNDIDGSHGRVSTDSAASFVRNFCGITQLCYFPPKPVTSDTAEFWKQSGHLKNARGPQRAKQSRRLLKRLNSFFRYKRKL